MSEPGPVVELDLWCPAGSARGRLALGRAARAIDQGDGEGPVDVVVIAPQPTEASDAWLRAALATAANCMTDDAVAVVIVPRRWRRAAERAIEAANLVLVDAALTVPEWPATQLFVPIATAPLADGGRYFGLGPLGARVAGAAARLGVMRRLIRRHAPGCALISMQRSASEPFAWFAAIDGTARAVVAVSGPTRRDAPTAVALRYPSTGNGADVAIKVAFDDAGRTRIDQERARLSALGPEAARAGARVPAVDRGAPSRLLCTSIVPGVSAATVLDRRPSQLARVAHALIRWLANWNRATSITATATEDLLRRLVLDAADRVAANNPRLSEYTRFVGDIAFRLQGQPMVLVAAHNDLTMANVIDGSPQLGILDWEAADPTGLPLTDLWYALTDAVSRGQRITHTEAVEALALGGDPIPSWLSSAPTDLAESLAVPANETLLAFHACWLHHAANELARGDSHGRFLAVVHAVATRRLLWPEPAPPTRSP